MVKNTIGWGHTFVANKLDLESHFQQLSDLHLWGCGYVGGYGNHGTQREWDREQVLIWMR